MFTTASLNFCKKKSSVGFNSGLKLNGNLYQNFKIVFYGTQLNLTTNAD